MTMALIWARVDAALVEHSRGNGPNQGVCDLGALGIELVSCTVEDVAELRRALAAIARIWPEGAALIAAFINVCDESLDEEPAVSQENAGVSRHAARDPEVPHEDAGDEATTLPPDGWKPPRGKPRRR